MCNLGVTFREMTDEEFNKFEQWDIEDYSKALIKSGLSSKKDAMEAAKKSFNDLLPQGKYTKDSYVYIILNNDYESVGFIWYEKLNEDIAFICDFLILEQFRRKGYGKQALLLVEKDAKEKGLNKMLLNVFKYNTAAFSLYKTINYKIRKETDQCITMIKDI